MTRPHNPLGPVGGPLGRSRPAYIEVKGEQVPTDLDGYRDWLNAHEHRRGRWGIIEEKRDGVLVDRRLDFQSEIATDDWLREKGLIPKIGRAA